MEAPEARCNTQPYASEVQLRERKRGGCGIGNVAAVIANTIIACEGLLTEYAHQGSGKQVYH
ncbi:MAG: hypothetical protein K2M11_10570 [Paramuribaculum sp.]|nr:hypothetical protein [Paramuribaculum sp.]